MKYLVPLLLAFFAGCSMASTQQLLDADIGAFDKSAPTLIYPANEAPLLGLTNTLVWTAKSGVGRYRLEIYSDSAYTNRIAEYSPTTTSQVVTFPDSQTYYYALSAFTSKQITKGTLHVLDAIYVYCPAGATCSDTGRTGTKNLPYQTLEGAGIRAQQLDFSPIRVAARDTSGTASYSQLTVSLGNGKSLYGGYNPDFSSRNVSTYKTVIENVVSSQAAVAFSGATKSAVVDGITFKGFISIEYSGQKLRFTNNSFEINGANGAVLLTNSSAMFRANIFKVPVQGTGVAATFLENIFNSQTDMINVATNNGVIQSRIVIVANSFYSATNIAGTRYGIRVADGTASAVIMKNFLNPGSAATCYGIQLDANVASGVGTGPANSSISGNSITMPGTCALVTSSINIRNATAGTSNSVVNNILVSNGIATRAFGDETSGSVTPSLKNNLPIENGSGGVFNKWYVNGVSGTNMISIDGSNLNQSTIVANFVDWDGPDNNLGTPDNDQSLLLASPGLNAGFACGSLTTRNQVWGAGGSANDCETRYPGSVYTGGFCQTTHLRDTVEILDDGIGNDNGLCEANETCLYNPNMGAYWGHGSLVDSGCNVSGVISGVTLKKYAQNGY